MPRYLTKSRFILAMDCPAKLYYTGKDFYPDKSADNDLLDALAKGGFQVGALARCYFPSGIDIRTPDHDQAVAETRELLQQENVTIFEAAIRVEMFFIRVDILEKKGDRVNLIEVKSKSFSGDSSLDMMTKKGFLHTNWKQYVYDVAFQKHVLSLYDPGWQVNAFLMLADKRAISTVDGLNQKFLLREQKDERTLVEYVGDVTPPGLGREILTRVNVDDLCRMIYEKRDSPDPLPASFGEYCSNLADHYWNDEKIPMPIHKDCGNCQFRATPEEEQEGKISGFKECLKEQLHWTGQDFEKPTIFDI